jgi:hypothetical protein
VRFRLLFPDAAFALFLLFDVFTLVLGDISIRAKFFGDDKTPWRQSS